MRLLINGLSVGSGGGYTVARELWRHLAIVRPTWQVTMALASGHSLHESIKKESAPANCDLFWASPEAGDRRKRSAYEKTVLADHARKNFDAVLQLNGMIIPGLTLPTLVHHQDPWPYRPEAWLNLTDRVVAWMKRRATAYAIKHADCMGWTSGYLRDLICGQLKLTPKRSEVLYNGLPDDWLARARDNGGGGETDWASRPLRLVSVSNVNPYKRQDLVIKAMPALLKKPGLAGLKYHIAGHASQDYLDQLRQLARSLGVGEAVIIEGRVSDERVTELVSSAKAFVLMSVCESFGIPAVEAMSLGTPVVTSDCCAMPEVCGAAADLVPMDDLNALVETLAVALTDPTHASERVRLGRDQVQKFAWTETALRMARIFEEISRR